MSMMVSLLPPSCVKSRVQMLQMIVALVVKSRNDINLGMAALLILVRLFLRSGCISDVVNLFSDIVTIAQMSAENHNTQGIEDLNCPRFPSLGTVSNVTSPHFL